MQSYDRDQQYRQMNNINQNQNNLTDNNNNNQNNPFTNYQYKQPVKQQKSQTLIDPNQQSIKYYVISLALFIAAFSIYLIVWAVEKFAITHQISSHYYQKSYSWAISQSPAAYQLKISSTTQGIALGLVFDWVMWKAPLIYFIYNCIKLKQGLMKWVSLGIGAGILLGADIALTIFLASIYNNYMYFGLFSIVTVILTAINNAGLQRPIKQAIFDSFLPLLYIGIVHAIQVVGLPNLYQIYINNLDSQSAVFMIFYIFPLFDFIMYAYLLFTNTKISSQIKIFSQQLHFLTLGYSVGFIMLVGYTQVQFYYLLGYFIFRNIFCNYVMWKWQSTLNLPPALPVWVLVYYSSYLLMFVPYVGIGNIITSIGYYSFLFVNTSTVLYPVSNTLYPYSSYNPTFTLTNYDMNTSFQGKIYRIAGVVIWIGLTFSQKYNKRMPQIISTLIYNIFGVYLFYIGIGSSLATYSLMGNSFVV